MYNLELAAHFFQWISIRMLVHLTQTDQMWHGNTSGEVVRFRGQPCTIQKGWAPQIFLGPLPMLVRYGTQQPNFT